MFARCFVCVCVLLLILFYTVRVSMITCSFIATSMVTFEISMLESVFTSLRFRCRSSSPYGADTCMHTCYMRTACVHAYIHACPCGRLRSFLNVFRAHLIHLRLSWFLVVDYGSLRIDWV